MAQYIMKTKPLVVLRTPSVWSTVRHYQACTISKRLAEKMHRLEYHRIMRPSNKYQQLLPRISPNLSHFLVEYDMQQRSIGGTGYTVETVSIPWKFRTLRVNLLLEPIMYNIMCAALDDGRDDEWYKTTRDIRMDNGIHILRKFPSVSNNFDINDMDFGDYDLDTSLAQFVNELQLQSYDEELLRVSVAGFLVCVKHGLPYTMNDLIKWYKSYTAIDVTTACIALTDLTEIPGFIVLDLLNRTALSGQESVLKTDLWSRFTPSIMMDMQFSISRVRDALSNTLRDISVYHVTDLREFTRNVIQNLDNIKGFEYKKEVFGDRFINTLLWDISYDIYERMSSHQQTYDVVKVQEVLTSLLTKSNSFPNLTLRGQMGIVLAIRRISPEKAKELFVKTRAKFSTKQSELSTNDITALSIVRIALSETPNELLTVFNDMPNHKHQSSVWLAFIKKLHEFGILTFERSHKILIALVNNSENVLLTKNIMYHLLSSVEMKKQFSQMLTVLVQHDYPLETLRNMLLEKFLTLLYASPKQFTGTWPIKLLLPSLDVRGYVNCLHLAKIVYRNFPARKTARLVGVMLKGVAQVKPRGVYDIYKTELLEKNLQPDSNCLTALLIGAMSKPGSNDEEYLAWGTLYAPQVAVGEFKHSVAQDSKDIALHPTSDLWHSYIRLLKKYQYVSELSEIIGWWEHLQYVPTEKNLRSLLKALPIEFARRHIAHIEKVRGDSGETDVKTLPGNGGSIVQWPWPSIEEIEGDIIEKNTR